MWRGKGMRQASILSSMSLHAQKRCQQALIAGAATVPLPLMTIESLVLSLKVRCGDFRSIAEGFVTPCAWLTNRRYHGDDGVDGPHCADAAPAPVAGTRKSTWSRELRQLHWARMSRIPGAGTTGFHAVRDIPSLRLEA